MQSPVQRQPAAQLAERRRIHIRGLVQGVGFRPHVFRCAGRFGVTGFVRNGPEGVSIEAEGCAVDAFVRALTETPPPLARIDSVIEAPLPVIGDRDFSIDASDTGSAVTGAAAAIPADTAICDSCLRELFDPHDRRYLHPFIACCDCGPRFTMTHRLPYDRAGTSMAPFALCPACAAEYTDPTSRRFHAEPVACHDCGPQLSRDIGDVASALAAGEVVAIRGLGGYHLACDARDDDAVRRLRSRKRRDGKPFAVMVLNTACAARYVELDAGGCGLLQSRERPVVVAQRRNAAAGVGEAGLSAALAPGLATLGLMLPHTAVHYLLFHALLGQPRGHAWLDGDNACALVMTSANISGDPLIADTDEAGRRLAGIADSMLHHDREIAARIDDSVLRVSGATSCIIRRARGYTPRAINLGRDGPRVLALGAHLKSTVTMTRGELAYVSGHVGDLETPAAIAFHRDTAAALQQMLQADPQRLACDWNPDFASTRLAEQLSDTLVVPLVRVQHHHAHAAAVFAEHRIEKPGLAMVLDGHGLGVEGQSWGGEMLLLGGGEFERLGHFAGLPLPGGDRAAREPWRMSAGVLHRLGRGGEIAQRFSQEPLAGPLSQWLGAGEVPATTAAGRLFDAAAGLLGVSRRAAFEGEPPMQLEGLVRRLQAWRDLYTLCDGVLDFQPLLARLADCDDPVAGAEGLHGTVIAALVDWALDAAQRSGSDCIALCGGCFLNMHLAREVPARLQRQGLRVLLPRALPPNDGAISLGQAWVAQRSHCRGD